MEDFNRRFPVRTLRYEKEEKAERKREKMDSGGGDVQKKVRQWKRQTGMGEEHQMLSSQWSGISVWIQAPWLMRIINTTCPAPLNAAENWKMGYKNKTSQAYPHKIHRAGACKEM